MRRILLAALTCVPLLACSVSNGTPLTDAQVSQFTPGLSTITDVRNRLGPPTRNEANSDGTTALVYSWGTNTAAGQSYIPVVGPFIAKSNYTGSTVTYLFGPNGVLRNMKRESENRGQGMGS